MKTDIHNPVEEATGMSRKGETKDFRIHLMLLLAGLIGLSLILGGTGKAQKPLIDLNSASEKELESIKGVGPAMAKKIVAGRPYKSVDDLSKAGIPAKTVEGMKPLVKVGPPAPPAPPAAAAKPAAPPAPPKAPAKEMPTKASAPAVPVKETPAKVAPAPSASTVGTQKASSSVPAAKAPAKTATAAPAKLVPGQKVNINTATKEQLEALPEVGTVKAQAIIDGRPYKKAEDVMKVKGIKEGTFNKIKDWITVY